MTHAQIGQYESEHGELPNLGRLVLEYKVAHEGRLPERVSELASYDAYKKTWPNGYVLSSRPNSSGVLVFEKPGLWPDGSVAVCYSDLTVKRLTLAEFSALGLEQFSVQ
jgi:hypothetical protein